MSVPPGDPPETPKSPDLPEAWQKSPTDWQPRQETSGCERAAMVAVGIMLLFLLVVFGTCLMHAR